MDPLDMIGWHSMSRPGSATLGRDPEMRRLSMRSYALACSVHLVILVVAFYALGKTAEALRLSTWPGAIEVAVVAPPSTPLKHDADASADAVSVSSAVSLHDVVATGSAEGPPGDATREQASDAPNAGNLGASTEAAPPVGPSAAILPTPDMASSQADPPPPDAQATKPVDPAPRQANEPPKPGVNSPTQRASGRSDAKLASAGPLALTPGTPRAGGAGALKIAAGVVLSSACPRPADARARGETGTVDISVEVDANGTLRRVNIDRSSGSSALDKAGMTCIRSWKFRPALLSDDRPIGATIVVQQKFSATD
jgi:TonB family protein